MSVIDITRRPLDLSGKWSLASANEPRAVITFEMEQQCHSNWCWAAVAASVAAHYDAGTYLRQCDIANAELGRTDCCQHECGVKDVDCNVTNVFASPLSRVDCLQRLARFQQATPAQVLAELQAGQPICVRTVWPDGGAHFVAIVGCWFEGEERPMLGLDDPFWGRSEYSYDRFATQYQLLGGKWNDTYYTRSPR